MDKKEIKKLDQIWRELVKEEFDNKCMICQRKEFLDCHHIFPREIKELRHEVLNGVLLCKKHHKYSYEISAHKNSVEFLLFYIKKHPYRFNKLNKIRSKLKLDEELK